MSDNIIAICPVLFSCRDCDHRQRETPGRKKGRKGRDRDLFLTVPCRADVHLHRLSSSFYPFLSYARSPSRYTDIGRLEFWQFNFQNLHSHSNRVLCSILVCLLCSSLPLFFLALSLFSSLVYFTLALFLSLLMSLAPFFFPPLARALRQRSKG
jgi:hypothetical protein